MKQVLKLDKVFCCRVCRAAFIFESDVEDHADASGHRQIQEIDI